MHPFIIIHIDPNINHRSTFTVEPTPIKANSRHFMQKDCIHFERFEFSIGGSSCGFLHSISGCIWPKWYDDLTHMRSNRVFNPQVPQPPIKHWSYYKLKSYGETNYIQCSLRVNFDNFQQYLICLPFAYFLNQMYNWCTFPKKKKCILDMRR